MVRALPQTRRFFSLAFAILFAFVFVTSFFPLGEVADLDDYFFSLDIDDKATAGQPGLVPILPAFSGPLLETPQIFSRFLSLPLGDPQASDAFANDDRCRSPPSKTA